MPLPRFWYLPRGEKAAVVMTGDDHGNGGTDGQFDRFKADEPGRLLGRELGVRARRRPTSSRARRSPTPGARPTRPHGFEIALHLEHRAASDFTPASLAQRLGRRSCPSSGTTYPSAGRAGDQPHALHRLERLGERADRRARERRPARHELLLLARGVGRRTGPGMFTGSGFPMRFADTDGSLIDVYQAATQLTDESGIDYAAHIEALLDGALGPQGYYGVFTANMHTDDADHAGADAIVAEARRAACRSSRPSRCSTWLDGRNDSSFGGLSFNGNRAAVLDRSPGAGANGLRGDAAGRRADRRARRPHAQRRRGPDRRRGRVEGHRLPSCSTRPRATTWRPTATRRSRRRPRRRSPPSR